MKLNEAIVILENHNEWGRDKEVPNSIVMVDPAELGIAIDVVVSEVKKFNISGVGSCPDLTSVWNEAVTKQDKGEHNLFVTNDCWGALRLLEKHGLCKISKL